MTDVVTTSRATMATHARSFSWAGAFLPAHARDDAAIVYAFCRLVDDLADEAPDPETAAIDLASLRAELTGQAPQRPLVATVVPLFERRGVTLQPAIELMNGVCSDLEPVRVCNDEELLRYCYRVASTVGLMMCGVLNVTHPTALRHAVDLGVAMQLTNICRDVLEDAKNDRVYLPADRLKRAGTSTEALLSGEFDHEATAIVVLDLLDLADRYYASADQGMRYIPLRSRFAIVVASRVYRAIGVKLRNSGGDALQGRTIVGRGTKVLESAAAIARTLRLSLGQPQSHDRSLHLSLVGLPGTHL